MDDQDFVGYLHLITNMLTYFSYCSSQTLFFRDLFNYAMIIDLIKPLNSYCAITISFRLTSYDSAQDKVDLAFLRYRICLDLLQSLLRPKVSRQFCSHL